ncbi:hypothetical protein BT96DRAFT_1015815 [Gymnopus androsaceus JB14]|uniref:BZIP domain-containing protein n=1 Tax=Gymnopus androsaceus JB14 TaxID=1447944 RepID=A0A6A4I8X5_9AGAR|nr:hypothetical protein BT96DRAFT_1015815 [Gymnopus androsaceus JB14]
METFSICSVIIIRRICALDIHSTPPPFTVRSQTSISRKSNSVAISASLKLSNHTATSQNVPTTLSTPAVYLNPSTTTRNGPASPDVSSPVYSLAAHYGIPQSLPRPPRTTPHLVSQEKLTDFESLSRNYISMLANKPSDNTPTMSTENDQIEITVMPPPAVPHVEEDHGADGNAGCRRYPLRYPFFSVVPHQNFTMAQTFNEYLCSPFSTPYDDFSTSPMDDSPFIPDLSTPIMDSYDDEFGWMSAAEPAKEPAPVTPAAELLSSSKLLIMSPATPALETVHSLYPSPRLPTFQAPAPAPVTKPASAPAPARKVSSSGATGTRRNITPDALVPLDAPTQNRRHVTPSASKKRSRSAAFGDAEDCEQEEDLPPMQAPGPDATDLEKLEWKRRLSTIAARKSRRRKLEHKMMLESKVDELEKDREKWRTRCRVLQEVLRSHSVDFRFEDDDEH